MVLGWPSPTLPKLRSNETTLLTGIITREQESWLGSLPFLGAFFSSPFYSYVIQNLGRKATGYLSAVPTIIGHLFLIYGNSLTELCIGRLVMGFSLSGINIFLALYIGEISEDSIRGTLGNFRGLVIDAGIIAVYAIGSYLSIVSTAAVCVAVSVVFLLEFFWLPESPMFLLGRGKSDEALEAYLWLRGGDTLLAEEETAKLNAVVSKCTAHAPKMTVRNLLSVRGTRNALMISLALVLVTLFSGFIAIVSYCDTVFEMLGSNMAPSTASIIVSVVCTFGSLLACLLSDIVGRRILLIWTQALQGLFLGVLGAYLYARYLGVDVSVVGVLPVICVSLYCFCITAGPANLLHVVMGEIFRPEARGVAMSITSSALWLLAFLSTKFYPSLIDLLEPHGCFWLFAAVSIAGAVFIFFKLPETKNRCLDSILRELNGDPPEEVKQPT
jgi:SP family facilitated glucose transporter-like MFS transporter 8